MWGPEIARTAGTTAPGNKPCEASQWASMSLLLSADIPQPNTMLQRRHGEDRRAEGELRSDGKSMVDELDMQDGQIVYLFRHVKWR